MQWKIVIVLIISVLRAENIQQNTPLFATVKGIVSNDTLNVRIKADHRSKKVAKLPLDAYVGVDRCKKTGVSVWCKIHHIAQHDYEGYGYDAPSGWVNAKYLTFYDRGYVLIDGKGKCDYAIGCKAGKCEIVSEYRQDENYNIVDIETKWIGRNRLKAESNFGAAANEMDGYCTNGSYIEDYLQKKRLNQLQKRSGDPAYQSMLAFVKRYDIHWPENIAKFIHTQFGIRLSYHTIFDIGDKLFYPQNIRDIDKTRNKKLFWGYTDGKGDEVRMSIYDFLATLPHDIETIKEIKTLPDLKGYKCPAGAVCKGYELLWYDKPIEEDHSWEGLVVIVQQYQGKWYVVGLLRDRWTI